MAGVRQFADPHECHRIYDCDTYHPLQIQILQSHPRLADHKLPVVALDVLRSILRVSVSQRVYFQHCTISRRSTVIVCFFFHLQASAEGIQHSDGSIHVRYRFVEFRRSWYDLHPLAGAVATSAGISDLHFRLDGASFHKVPTRMDGVGCTRRYKYLG